MESKGQVTIFIIIAIIIVASVGAFFAFRGSIGISSIPSSMEPVYTSFLSCLEEDVSVGIDVLESQGGYIELPEFEPGSTYMPFSSQLNFLGNPIPYWYYVSGNGVEKEQVPTKREMERELESFVEGQIKNCVLDKYYEQGFEINQGEPDALVTIRNGKVNVNLKMNLDISKGDDSAFVVNHNVDVNSNLGSLYDEAKDLYEYEQQDLFLEEYAVDTLRLYAPVDGIEITCSPKVWSADGVFNNLSDAVEFNVNSLKVEGGDYTLSEDGEYFVLDYSSSHDVRFFTSKNWPSTFEVSPSEGNVLMAEPVGTQPGLGILGFCYVPYHFVYAVKYPVLVQVSEGEEIFQFPMAVVVEGNRPREALDVSAVGFESSEMCEYKNTEVQVNVYNTQLNSVDADISYECFGEVCHIGETSQGSLTSEFPQCVNGFVVVRADGFEEARHSFSTTTSGSVDIIMDKLYELDIDLLLDDLSFNDEAIIYFTSGNSTKTVVYPSQKSVELSEGQYEIEVYIYDNSNLKFPELSYEKCMDVPSAGLGGFFGMTQKKCFDVEVPSQIVSNVLVGGGSENYYVTESELVGAMRIEINSDGFPVPESLDELQENNLLFEEKGLEVNFR